MATLIQSTDFNINGPDPFGQKAVQSNQTPTGFTAYAADLGNHIYISGQNFQYSGSNVVSGTVSSMVCVGANGQETLWNITGINQSIEQINSYGEGASFFNGILGPNPTVTTIPGGINGSETINAPSGSNQVYGYTGHNTVVYSAPSTQFTINVNDLLSASNGTVTVIQGDPLTSGNVNTLHAIQSIQFSDQTIQTSWLTKASALRTADATEFKILSEMYLAYFNRAPDAVGLDYWASQAVDWQAAQPGVTFSKVNGDIANVFSGTPEAISAYGTVTQQSSPAQLQTFVTSVYNNVLNRAPDSAGLNYWVGNLQTGASSPGSFIRDIIYSVNAQTGSADNLYLNSKTTVGNYFATTKGLTDVAQAKNVMTTFNNTYNTSGANAAVNAANALTDSYSNGLASHPELIVHLVGIS